MCARVDTLPGATCSNRGFGKQRRASLEVDFRPFGAHATSCSAALDLGGRFRYPMASVKPDPHELAGQVLIAGFHGTAAPEELLEAIARRRLGGVILFKRNLGQPIEVARLVATMVDAAPSDLPLLVAIDQEGGRVARLGPPVLRLPPMRLLARTGDVSLVEESAYRLGLQLAALGITMDFAPVLDVDTNPANPVIGDRAFGATPDEVVRFASAFARGLARAGVASCGKHFPGHGDTDLDSHLALPKLGHARSRLDAIELAPFRAAEGMVPAIMSAHVVFDALEPGIPATLSRAAMTDLLRGELGYRGLCISDDLEMKAVADLHEVGALAVGAVRAGCDALLVCSDLARLARAREALAAEAERDPSFYSRLVEASGRHLALRRRHRSRPRTDEAALLAAFDAPATAELETRITNALAEIPR